MAGSHVDEKQPNPVVSRAAVAAVVATAVAMLRVVGVEVPGDIAQIVIDVVVAAVPVVAVVWAAVSARRKVTPITSPKNNQGVPLVPSRDDG